MSEAPVILRVTAAAWMHFHAAVHANNLRAQMHTNSRRRLQYKLSRPPVNVFEPVDELMGVNSEQGAMDTFTPAD